MTGPEHYREAEDCLARARRASDKNREEDAAFWQREAGVHATLAAAAASALMMTAADGSYYPADEKAWHEVAGSKPDEGTCPGGC